MVILTREQKSSLWRVRAELNTNTEKYMVSVVQTEYKKTLTPDDRGEEPMFRANNDLIQEDEFEYINKMNSNILTR